MKDPLYKIGIVGYGVVGKGIHRLFGDLVGPIYDPAIDSSREDEFRFVDMVVICVPTNETKEGYADTNIVWESLKWLSKVLKSDTVILIKSTTPPQELRAMQEEYPNVVFSPEFMGESKYFTPFWKYPDPVEMKYHDFQVFGGHPEYTSKCIDIFIRVMGPHVKYHQTDIATAGLAKYMENSFFAMKVTFCNEWFDIAQAHKVDYNTLRELWLLDSRISPMHTAVFPRDRGYGGKCYPKDTRAIIYEAEELGYEPELMKTMDRVNTKFRNKT